MAPLAGFAAAGGRLCRPGAELKLTCRIHYGKLCRVGRSILQLAAMILRLAAMTLQLAATTLQLGATAVRLPLYFRGMRTLSPGV